MVLLLGAVLVACRSSVRRLDEASLYESPAFKLKVVRYHQRLPFSYDGAIAHVQCSSDKTRDVKEGTVNDPGWVSVAYVPALGSRSAQELVEKARVSFTVRSKAFKPHPELNIFSDDGGRTWQTAVSNAERPGSGAEGSAR